MLKILKSLTEMVQLKDIGFFFPIVCLEFDCLSLKFEGETSSLWYLIQMT